MLILYGYGRVVILVLVEVGIWLINGVEKICKLWFWEGRSTFGARIHASPPYIILVIQRNFRGGG
ncbi:hypothetical protein, partial [Halocalculus aciditolerans]|uniref:hypothetical protein n=1 Tax=Halocalculus aciditolerans TaxID=1383812 RepID=UPI001E2F1239